MKTAKAVLFGLAFAFTGMLGLIICAFPAKKIDAVERERIEQIWQCRTDAEFESDEYCASLYRPGDSEFYLRRHAPDHIKEAIANGGYTVEGLEP